MPEREALALLEAIDDYIAAYANDPAYEELTAGLAQVKEVVQAARGEAPEGESPGSQAAREASEQPPEGAREPRREDVSQGQAEGEDFETAGREARGRMREGARAGEAGTASRRRRGRY